MTHRRPFHRPWTSSMVITSRPQSATFAVQCKSASAAGFVGNQRVVDALLNVKRVSNHFVRFAPFQTKQNVCACIG
eukprot:m.61369 g.61369  ORF g.61369 m.61369 type:complete len:76 (-) comp11860_c0_seq1:624-851(-)